jgi:uncharacterized membrane protein YkvA (DUF1232 family)
MAKTTKEQAEEQIKNNAKNIKQEDIDKLIKKQKEIEEKIKNNGPLAKFINDVTLFFSLLKDYINNEYREIPWWSIAAIATALFYVINPMDIIPDFIPIVGYIDDAVVVGACLTMVQNDLEKYKQWKKCN